MFDKHPFQQVVADAERFLSESGCRWLAKPFRMKELLRAAREVIVVRWGTPTRSGWRSG